MPNTLSTGDVRGAVERAFKSTDDLTMQSLPRFVDRANVIAAILGVKDIDFSGAPVHDYPKLAQALLSAVDGLIGMTQKAAPGPNSSIVALREFHQAQIEALLKLQHAHQAANRINLSNDSMISVAKFQRHPDGSVTIVLPEDVPILEFGIRANKECLKLGISPAFDTTDTDWWVRNERAKNHRTVPGEIYRMEVPADSISKSRRAEEAIFGNLVPPGALAVAAICVHLESLGKEDFLNSLRVRTSAPNMTLRMAATGVAIHDDVDEGGSSSDVGCARQVKIGGTPSERTTPGSLAGVR